ncbi:MULTISPECIES: rod shape-determining protein MreC [Lysinibacillus]|jgi:rod shape-determining protein MreC|uniref:Cell shape-determining protein MreC n=1 Tax=Lysinibacillus capsici TaxID=2115968 RepID=A0A2X1AI83_9BACI|nr:MULTISPECIES: rod shape-determining protein MreC [Lysinibacillus]AUS87696.1 rod shape-determining protein MreC [Lysinibacillus sp. YS11]KMN37664.1 rod shape-determining protein MreC [Lysinibacillus sp. LK3]MCM0624428.1 rod shape-determining protein MreC [Lysinibacillus sp. OL1_EC]MCR6521347.1 rod shape-determining protein MreC [Lysinibacillus capsici]MCS5500790.1 rod shape-determining protein MreC [Lysinibacillus sp. A4]
MPHFFFNKKVILLLIGMVFLVALISFSLRDRTNATLPEQIIKDTVGFAQSLVAKPANYINGVFNSIDSLLNTYEENKRLKARLEDFAVVQAEATDLKSENNKLRELLDKTESLKAFNPIQATVIARNPDQWEEKIILDKGSSHGVKKNMAVMTAKGLVGKITLVTPFTSEVELLNTNNPNYRVSAMVLGEKEAYGLIEGFDEERNELIMKRIDSSMKVKEGEQVVSSGLGGIFPKGVPIGEITEVSTDDFGLTKMAYVKPSADFSILEHVVIAKRTSTSIDGSDGNATNEDLSNPQEASEEEAE